MHPRRALALAATAVIAATVPLLSAAAPAPGNSAAPPADRAPVCGNPAARGFPIDSRLHDGPSGYAPGLEADGFALDLTNTTDGACRDVHPLVILVDRDGTLTGDQFTLRYRPPGGDWRAVPFESTDRGEFVGIPGGQNGPGLTIPAGATVTVRLQLWFAPSAPADRVVASATTMQRRGQDGSWVAESNHYPFDIVPAPPTLADTGAGAGRPDGALFATGAAAAALIALGTALVVGARRPRD
ncbi:hypothetical protein POF50_024660 [Streptomyces sp. SL13]|uniref:Gram-positive cocci surface proteins LPxTG domain-containing protein n=1 Tax=Streptantibioticus silvisoli TaxID=2705255 RepID=A0AA90KAJ5_9ACTN|nr:hypothetical protein [Streptantibioticus silvisoli]MDI5972493.1 hypothetical protein [Streptantibioticus silvisoli]